MCCLRNPLNNLSVIPGKLAIASATRNLGISKTSGCAFRSMTGRETLTSFANFSSRTLIVFQPHNIVRGDGAVKAFEC
jgi:hypothetical protein